MKKIYLFIGLALSMLAGGCSKDDPIDNPVGPVDKDDVTVKVTATIAEEGLLWSEGATVAINGFESSALATGGEAAATFEIKNVSAPLKVVAPFKAYGAGDVVTVPDTQKYVAGGYDADAFVMYGYAAKFVETEESEETEENKTAAAEVEMHAACGIVKLPVAIAEGSAVISSISLTAANEEAVAGSWKFDFTNGAATAEKVFSTVALDCGENGVALGASAVDFRFVIPAAAYAKGVIIEAATTDGHKFVCDYKEALTVVAGAETALEPMDFKIIEKADATLNITIAEPAITWAAGDEVVVNGVLSSALADADAGKSTASFDLKSVAYPYTVLYPSDLYTTSGRLRFYDEQRLLKNEFDREALAMVGYSFDTDVTLHNVCGLIKIPVFNNFEGEVVTLQKVCIRSNDGSPLAGKYNINYRNATLSLVSAVDTMTLVPEEGSKGIEIPVGEKVYVYAVVPEGKFPQGLTLDVYTNVENQTDILCTPAGGLNVTRGVETELETVEYTDVKIEAITTAEEFVEFAKCVNNGRYKKFINSEGEVVLGGDIDMSGVEWTAITGPENAGFDGIFNGKDFAIRNFTSSNPIFGVVSETGVIKNLKIDASCKVNISEVETEGKDDHGYGVLAAIVNGRIENVTSGATLTFGSADAPVAVSTSIRYIAGGIVGILNGSIENCHTTGGGVTIIGKDAYSIYVGGIVGMANDSAVVTVPMTNAASIACTFDTCQAPIFGGVLGRAYCDVIGTETDKFLNESGNISLEIKSKAVKSSVNIGGVFGRTDKVLKYAENKGNIFVRNNQEKENNCYVAGVIGLANAEVGYCTNFGTIDAYCAYTSVFGGVVSSSTKGPVHDCVNNGDVIVSAASKTKATYVGGVLAYMNDTKNAGLIIKDCVNNGKVTVTGIDGYQLYVAGMVGYYNGASNQTLSTWNIDGCTNNGEVTLNTNQAGRFSYVAGFIGNYKNSCGINNCVNNGVIYGYGGGRLRVGGIGGAVNYAVYNCVHKGVAKLGPDCDVATAGSESQVGGIAGYYNAFLSNCEVYGDVICETKGAFAGGLTGWVSTCKLTYTGGKMAGNVTAVDGAYVGIVLGGQNKAAGTLGAHTLGTADAPIVISSKATINGVAVTAADAADKAKICGKLEDEAKLTVNTVFEE